MSEFSKTVPDDRTDGMISILTFGMIRNSLGQSGDKSCRKARRNVSEARPRNLRNQGRDSNFLIFRVS